MTRWFLLLGLTFAAFAQPVVTPPPAGPYRVEGNRILDHTGRPYLIRGTTLPPIILDSNPAKDFGPFSRTTLITLRQRLNMNAVRLPIDSTQYETNPGYRLFVKDLVEKANQLELLVILESASPAADFKSNPNVFFAVPDQAAATAIRSQGVTQPIIVPSGAGSRPALAGNPNNFIYQFNPTFENLPSSLDQSVPLLAHGMDPQLTTAGPACEAFPSDPAEASKLIEDALRKFDLHSINWTISQLEPGKLIDNYLAYDWSKLDDGWTCGHPYSGAGIGMALLSHLWYADSHGVFTVNQPGGGLIIARGANASAYGRILADRETRGTGTRLSNISVSVTDARGVSRLAQLSWTGGGWASTNLIIPEASAPGPAEVAIVRTDGSRSPSRIIIADAAPGLWTANNDGRGPVIAQFFQHGRQIPAFQCDKACRTVPIPIPARVRVEGTGFHHASAVSAFIDGVPVPVESFGAEPAASRDQITIRLPATLTARGETDIYVIADGKLSNVARINLVGQVPDLPSARIQLGRYLFYDRRMSVNNSSSCASCHHQDLAFTDGRAKAIGATEQLHPRSAMSLVNLSQSTAYNWNDPTVRSLEQQALKPMRSTTPVELGLNEPAFLKLMAIDATYRPLFHQAFPNEANPYTIANVTRAIAAFERTITSTNSPYDRFHRYGDESAISESAKRGELLFYLDGGPSCFRCHNGPNFSDSAYHNNGLGAPGTFKTPTLRNIAVTAPYMHDGSIATLEQVVDHYASGGKPGHDPIMRGFQLTSQNRADLVAFLKSLTDENLLYDPRYGNPWP